MEPLGWLIVLYYIDRNMGGRYNIHALFHGKTVTKESKELLSEGRFEFKK